MSLQLWDSNGSLNVKSIHTMENSTTVMAVPTNATLRTYSNYIRNQFLDNSIAFRLKTALHNNIIYKN